jgi:hypothetical protein
MRYDRTPGFPSVDGALTGSRYEDFWMLGMQHSGVPGRKFFDEVVHGSWKQGECNDVYALPPGEYLGGEPVLIANPKDHGEAVVIVQHLQPATDQAAFVVLDAFNVKSGPIARIPLREPAAPGISRELLARLAPPSAQRKAAEKGGTQQQYRRRFGRRIHLADKPRRSVEKVAGAVRVRGTVFLREELGKIPAAAILFGRWIEETDGEVSEPHYFGSEAAAPTARDALVIAVYSEKGDPQSAGIRVIKEIALQEKGRIALKRAVGRGVKGRGRYVRVCERVDIDAGDLKPRVVIKTEDSAAGGGVCGEADSFRDSGAEDVLTDVHGGIRNDTSPGGSPGRGQDECA